MMPSLSPQRAWRMTALIAALFCVLVAGDLLWRHAHAKQADPWRSPRLNQLKEKLVAAPNDEALKQEIRLLDQQLRQRYFRALSLNILSGWMLAGGLASLVFSLRQARRISETPCAPLGLPPSEEESLATLKRSRRSVAAATVVSFAILGAFVFTSGKALSSRDEAGHKHHGGDDGQAGTVPDRSGMAAAWQANWPRFRGPDGNAVSTSTNPPLHWNGATGTGVVWQVAAGAPGFNSPIVWSNRLFYSGGDAARREVFCHDAATGKLLWRRAIENVPGSPAQQPEIPEMTGFAPPTMVCDGQRVYVIFANADLAALTLDGQPVWSKYVGPLENQYGHASSLAFWQDRLIVQLDQGEQEAGKSKLLALDGATGRVVWQAARRVAASWATPIVIEAAGRAQVITLAVPWITSHAAADGTELWKAGPLDGEVTPSPVFAAGQVIVVNPGSRILAIRPDGSGDVSKTRVVWATDDNLPDVTSPVSDGRLVFTVSSSGQVICFDAKDGKKVWTQDLEMEVQASPCLAGNHLYVIGDKGVTVVAEAGRAYVELARNTLGDEFLASPAFAGDRMYLRGKTNVWCLGAPAR
jgi:outer membrane protein assembly factor BamB